METNIIESKICIFMLLSGAMSESVGIPFECSRMHDLQIRYTRTSFKGFLKAGKIPFSILWNSKLKTVGEQNLNALNVCSHSLELMLHKRRGKRWLCINYNANNKK